MVGKSGQNKCCGNHKKPARTSLQQINQRDVDKYPHLNLQVGTMWCARCRCSAKSHHQVGKNFPHTAASTDLGTQHNPLETAGPSNFMEPMQIAVVNPVSEFSEAATSISTSTAAFADLGTQHNPLEMAGPSHSMEPMQIALVNPVSECSEAATSISTSTAASTDIGTQHNPLEIAGPSNFMEPMQIAVVNPVSECSEAATSISTSTAAFADLGTQHNPLEMAGPSNSMEPMQIALVNPVSECSEAATSISTSTAASTDIGTQHSPLEMAGLSNFMEPMQIALVNPVSECSEAATSISTSAAEANTQLSVDLFEDDYKEQTAESCESVFCIYKEDVEVDESKLSQSSSHGLVLFSSQEIGLDTNSKCCSFNSEDECGDLPHFKFKDLKQEEKVALVWASGKWDCTHITSICSLHFNKFLDDVLPLNNLPMKNPACIDPQQVHSPQVKKGLKKITLLLALKIRYRGYANIRAGSLICNNCRSSILEEPDLVMSTQTLGEVPTSQDSNVSIKSDPLSQPNTALLKIDAAAKVQKFGLSPAMNAIASIAKENRIEEARRKLSEASVLNDLCLLYDLKPDEIVPEKQLAAEYNTFLMELKNKILKSNNSKKIQFLTQCPAFWTESYASRFFGVSRYMIRKAMKLKEERGILAEPNAITRNRIDSSNVSLVTAFYENDDSSRIMPGKKDFVSIGRNIHKQKRLLLVDLKELYQLFKKKYESVKIGMSLFCSLRPKWCIIAGASGTHCVCVCAIHQNLKMLLYTLPIKKYYREIIDELLCDPDSNTCRLRICPSCPNQQQIVNILVGKVLTAENLDCSDFDNEEDYNEEVKDYLDQRREYQQWTSTDRAELVTSSASTFEIIELTASSIQKVITHDYIARQQAQYLNMQKEAMPPTKSIVLMDFSMNYSTVVQDAIQAQHWRKEQATLHTVVVYYKDIAGTSHHKSMCFISDDVDHDVGFVLLTQKEVATYIKNNMPWITEIEYFTDGCAKQYKNCKVFLNMCRHEQMFGLKASFSFFATSHGKSPCDGIGGTVKRDATRASLQRPLHDQIIGAQKLFDFCVSHDREIHFQFLSKAALSAIRIDLNIFGVKPSTVPGTRSFHNFVPISGYTIGCKRTTLDASYSLVHRLAHQRPADVHITDGDYALVLVEGEKYLAIISDVHAEEDEVDVSLLTPSVPSQTFTWPEEMLCLSVPLPHVLLKVELVEISNNSYEIHPKHLNTVNILVQA